MKEEVVLAALAGLLHDVGKLTMRAGTLQSEIWDREAENSFRYRHALASKDFAERFVPTRWKAALEGVAYHHAPQNHALSRLIQQADHLAAGERRQGEQERSAPSKTLLQPILSSVHLKEDERMAKVFYPLRPLSIEGDAIFPIAAPDPDSVERGYESLSNQLLAEMEEWKRKTVNWDQMEADAYYLTLVSILRKYLWCVPSATPWEPVKDRRTFPDLPLYEHLRLTSAIAACLAADGRDETTDEKAPVALLVRGDVSGIQNFIYRITNPGSETEHVAKRLRGRSYYLSAVMELTVEWILRSLGLPSVCALFVGGGRFDLILPLSVAQSLQTMRQRLQDWLLKTFEGELTLHIAAQPMSAQDFADTRPIGRRLDAQLELGKLQKWNDSLQNEAFYEPQEAKWHVCRICRLTPLADPGICSLCRQHEQIGSCLPFATDLVWVKTPARFEGHSDQVVSFTDAPFGMALLIIKDQEELQSVLTQNQVVRIVHLNKTDDFVVPNQPATFGFLANSAPILAKQVATFEQIAQKSRGAKRLGVLKADADCLGLVMSEGLEDESQNLRPTLSRVAALSSALDLFFAGYLNQICKLASQGEQKFYIMYSGGDDLFLVGPWDAVLELARKLNNEFQRYTGGNPSLSLSAGYVQVKPDYPTHKFSELVDEAEHKAKSDGRDRITAFNISMQWHKTEISFERMWKLATDIVDLVETKKVMPRGMIAELGRTFRMHKTPQGLNVMWTPRLHYILYRRMDKKIVDQLKPDLMEAMRGMAILVPVSISSLMTRKE